MFFLQLPDHVNGQRLLYHVDRRPMTSLRMGDLVQVTIAGRFCTRGMTC